MSDPICPPNYVCTFTPDPPEKHFIGPWWEGPWGQWVTLAAVIALVFIICWIAYYWYEAMQDKRNRRSAREKREFDLSMAEQFTTQVDMAKGDPEMLKIVQEQQRRIRS